MCKLSVCVNFIYLFLSSVDKARVGRDSFLARSQTRAYEIEMGCGCIKKSRASLGPVVSDR